MGSALGCNWCSLGGAHALDSKWDISIQYQDHYVVDYKTMVYLRSYIRSYRQGTPLSHDLQNTLFEYAVHVFENNSLILCNKKKEPLYIMNLSTYQLETYNPTSSKVPDDLAKILHQNHSDWACGCR
jgi:hypothetical protein